MLAEKHRQAAEDIENAARNLTYETIEGNNVARDGIVLYSRGSLPAPFAA
jgi:hypothetical protein